VQADEADMGMTYQGMLDPPSRQCSEEPDLDGVEFRFGDRAIRLWSVAEDR
jgi:hypothetical protein